MGGPGTFPAPTQPEVIYKTMSGPGLSYDPTTGVETIGQPAVEIFSEVESFEACQSNGLHVMSYASDDCSGDSLINLTERTSTTGWCKNKGANCP